MHTLTRPHACKTKGALFLQCTSVNKQAHVCLTLTKSKLSLLAAGQANELETRR